MIVEVTKQDLRNATKVRNNKRQCFNCVLAKAVRRATNQTVSVYADRICTKSDAFVITKKIQRIIKLFDTGKYKELRKMLPTKVRLMH